MKFGDKYVPYETLKQRAIEMRKNPTGEERKLWSCLLKDYIPKFHRQRVINPYIVDFCCPQLKIVIEIDGYQHCELQNLLYEEKEQSLLRIKAMLS